MSGSAMFESGSSERRRRTARDRVQACDDGLQSTPAPVPVVSSYARYVGRVGALAIALGVGSFLAAIPSAFADTLVRFSYLPANYRAR